MNTLPSSNDLLAEIREIKLYREALADKRDNYAHSPSSDHLPHQSLSSAISSLHTAERLLKQAAGEAFVAEQLS